MLKCPGSQIIFRTNDNNNDNNNDDNNDNNNYNNNFNNVNNFNNNDNNIIYLHDLYKDIYLCLPKDLKISKSK